jgi:hypothetical protein
MAPKPKTMLTVYKTSSQYSIKVLFLLFQKSLLKMVLNKRDLERAFSPNKHRRSGGHRSLNKSNRGVNSLSQTHSNMKVVVRVRPQNAKEWENNAR